MYLEDLRNWVAEARISRNNGRSNKPVRIGAAIAFKTMNGAASHRLVGGLLFNPSAHGNAWDHPASD